MVDSKPLAGRLQISVLELADCSIPGIFDIRATVTGETVLGKHWSHGYRSAHQPDSAVQVSHPIKNDEKRAFTPINAVMLLPLIGPVSHQFVVLDLRKGKTHKSDSKHKSLGFARLLLYPLMEGAADGHAKEQTIWLELRSLKALAHLTRTRFSRKSEDEPGTRTSTQSENAAVDESHDALHEPQGTVVGRLKVTVKLEVDRAANAAACYRPEQPIVVAYPPFSASRLLHAIAEVADHFINPISELIYEFMGMLNWERPLHTFIYLYFWLTFMVYIEWGMVLLHLLVIYFFFSGPLNRDFGLVELINLMLHPDDNAPQRDTDFTSTHYDVDLFHPRDIALRNLPRHHHLGPYPAVKHVSKRSEAREQGVRVGDMLTQVNGTGVGGESLETINRFLLDLEQESLANGGSEPVTMTFKRRAAGIHAATARRLAADATNALANVAAKSGGAIISGGKGVVKGFKKVLSSHSGVNADVVDVLEEEADKYQDHLLNYEDETAAILGKRVDSIATSFIAGNCRPEQLIFYDSVTGTMTMAVNGDDYDAAWVDPDVNNPTSLGLTMQAAIANAEGAAWFGKAVTKLFLWGNPVETRNTILGLAISCVVHCFLPNRYIYAGVVALLFVKHSKMFGAARFMLAARSAVALEEDVLIHGANRRSKSIGSFSMNELDQTFLLEYQQLRGGSWVEMDSTQIKPWCQPSNPRLMCRKNDVHHPHGRVWNGDWIVGRLVLTGEHPPVYNAEEVIGTSRGLRAGWEYAESLQELSSIPLGNNPSEPQLSSRMRYRLWFRRTQAKSD